MKDSRSLDFCVVGAQKSGTTSLHYYLKEHKQIRLPHSKEAPFFSDLHEFSKGLSWYFDEFFPGTPEPDVLFGTVSPTYMTYPDTAQRMFETFPKIKLIAVLRCPIERAESHYKMRVRAHGEIRSFEKVVFEQLTCSNEKMRNDPKETDCYIFNSEYGRILTRYVELFGLENILVLYSDDLKHKCDETLKKIYQFLGIDFEAGSSEKKLYNVTLDERPRTISVKFANALNYRHIRLIGKYLLPESVKRRLRFWSVINRHTGKGDGRIDVKLSKKTRDLLVEHFVEDMRALESLLGTKVSWRGKLLNYNNEG